MKKKKSAVRKMLSILITVMCIVTMLPTAAWAEDAKIGQESNISDESQSEGETQEDQFQTEDEFQEEGSENAGDIGQIQDANETEGTAEPGMTEENTQDTTEAETIPEMEAETESEAAPELQQEEPEITTESGKTAEELIEEAAQDQPDYIITGQPETRKDLMYRSGGNKKIVSVMGDSIATFQGYSSWMNYYYFYTEKYMSVNDTWWMKYIRNHGMKLGVCESLGSSRVAWDGREVTSYLGPDKCMASDFRIKNLGNNGTPDVILFFGGTNDIGYSQVGSFNPSKKGTATFANAYNTAILKMKQYYPSAQIICLTPYYQIYSADSKVDQYANVVKKVCDYYGLQCVDLRKSGMNISEDMCTPDYLHVNEKGHDKMWHMMEYGKPKLTTSGIYVAENSESKVSAGMNVSTYDGVEFQWQIYDCQQGAWIEGYDWTSNNWLTWVPQTKGWYWLHCTAKDSNGETVSYTQSVYCTPKKKGASIRCDGLTWLPRNDYLDVGAAFTTTDSSPEFRWTTYNVNKKEWVALCDWDHSNWVSWKAERDTYWLRVEMRTSDKKAYDEKVIAFQYFPGTAQITGTYTGWQDNQVLLGCSSNVKGAKYEFKLYDLDKKQWFWGTERDGQWAVWSPRKGNFWEHFECYSADGRLLDKKTYNFAIH